MRSSVLGGPDLRRGSGRFCHADGTKRCTGGTTVTWVARVAGSHERSGRERRVFDRPLPWPRLDLPFGEDDSGFAHSADEVAAVRGIPAGVFVDYLDAVERLNATL